MIITWSSVLWFVQCFYSVIVLYSVILNATFTLDYRFYFNTFALLGLTHTLSLELIYKTRSLIITYGRHRYFISDVAGVKCSVRGRVSPRGRDSAARPLWPAHGDPNEIQLAGSGPPSEGGGLRHITRKPSRGEATNIIVINLIIISSSTSS